MHHAAAENFEPARIFANLTARAAAYETFHVHFGAWFSEREVRSAESQTRAFAKHAPHKIGNCAFQVREGDILANRESFHLVELHLRPRRDLFVTETHPRQCNADRGRVARIFRCEFSHRVDLARRGMCAHQYRIVSAILSFDEEGILHFARRMMRRKIQQLKVIFIGFHFTRGKDLKAHLR